MYCLRVNVYCTTATGCLPNCSYQIYQYQLLSATTPCPHWDTRSCATLSCDPSQFVPRPSAQQNYHNSCISLHHHLRWASAQTASKFRTNSCACRWEFAERYWSQRSGYGDWLRYELSGDRIPGGGARFSTPVQTCPATHPASYTMGIGYFPGVKRPRGGVDSPLPSSVEV